MPYLLLTLESAATGESPILWSADGHPLYVYRLSEAPALVREAFPSPRAPRCWKKTDGSGAR